MKLKQKIIALNMATLFVVLVVLGTIIIQITDNNNLATILGYLENQGEYASIYIEQYTQNKARSVFEVPTILDNDASFLTAFLKRTVKCRVQLFYGDRLLGDSEEDTDDSHTVLRPEVAATFKKNSAYFILKENHHRTFYYATPVNIQNKYTYSLAFIYDLTEVDSMKTATLRILILLGVLSSVFIIFISSTISNRITAPINRLNDATKQFSKGNLSHRADMSTKDEVGELSQTFDRMADNIEDMINKLNYEKEKQKSFFDNFTHEIRTPLTTIIGYAELLWKTDSEEVKDKSLFHITSEGKRMLKMIERLLELSKLKKYNFELSRTNTNLKKLIEDVCDSLHYKAKRYNIPLRLELEEVQAYIDPDLIKQVILNIIDNSVKYSRSPNIDICLRQSDKIYLTITDYGIGMDAKSLENIFEPYFKVDKSRNSQVEGWGLGLSITKEILEKHQGTILIDSVPGKGTKVEIIL